MSDLICPKCGRSSDKVPFIEAFCADDYPVKLETPPRMEVEQCTRCKRIRLRGEWTVYTERKIRGVVLGRCKGGFDTADYDIDWQKAVFKLSGSGAVIERSIPLHIKKNICQDCSRVSGGYYEGIIQLRGDRARQEKYAKLFIEKLEKVTFISKTEEKDEGLDLYIGRSKPIVEMMGKLGIKTLITKKLV